jgi:phosphocarrier protein
MTFVETATGFSAEVSVRRSDSPADEAVDGKSIMHMMMLAATCGTELVITADGSDADNATKALKELIASGFDEH